MGKSVDQVLAEVSAALSSMLGPNLFSCCVYGSAVRGNAVAGVSDLNLLIVLDESSAAAHQTLGRVLGDYPSLDPFILDRASFGRTARCFANKFASIRRHYRVMHGADPFAGVEIDSALEKLLCEQALRNLRLRATYAFVMNGRGRNYREFLVENISAVFIQLSDVLRLSGHQVPKDFRERIATMQEAWAIDRRILDQLAEVRETGRGPAAREHGPWHEQLLALLDTVLRWIETHWVAAPGP